MLILPIVNKQRVMNVEVKLKHVKKIRSGVSYDDASPSDVIISKERFLKSSFACVKDDKAPIDFIRSRSVLYPRNFLVTTKHANDSLLYDVYEVDRPPKKVNDSLDSFYGKAITDLRQEIPKVSKRGRYISFEKLGIDQCLTDDKIAKLQKIVKEEKDSSKWLSLFERNGVSDLNDTIDFLSNFDYTVLSDYSIPEDSLRDTLSALEVINTRDYRNLKNYYEMAKSNTDIYTKISYIHQIIYDRPLTLLQAKVVDSKRFIKRKDDNEYK